jgi:hypothetical protein
MMMIDDEIFEVCRNLQFSLSMMSQSWLLLSMLLASMLLPMTLAGGRHRCDFDERFKSLSLGVAEFPIDEKPHDTGNDTAGRT